jgi:hypothetical protein
LSLNHRKGVIVGICRLLSGRNGPVSKSRSRHSILDKPVAS